MQQKLELSIGMGATICLYSDRHAATIIAVKGKTVTVQRDDAIRIDSNGMSDVQAYNYKQNLASPKVKYSLRKSGEYILVGDKDGGQRLHIGTRREYHDFSF